MCLHHQILQLQFQVLKQLMPIDEGLLKVFQLYKNIKNIYFRQKALKALNDRMKSKDSPSEAWPEMDEIHQTPLLPPTHEPDNSSVIIDMKNSQIKDDLNQQQTTS